jgi:hypothetical protein
VAGDRTFKVGLLVVFAGGPIVYGFQIEDGTLVLAYLTHKMSKSGLEVRKLQPLEVEGVVFSKQILNRTAHILFSNPSKSP